MNLEQTENQEAKEEQDFKIIKLINNDILIGNASKAENDSIVIENPYTIKDLGHGPCVLPYELDVLMEPMKFINFQAFNVLWIKNLKDFTEVHTQYSSATSGIDL